MTPLKMKTLTDIRITAGNIYIYIYTHTYIVTLI